MMASVARDQGEEGREKDIGGMEERRGQWLLSWGHIAQVLRVAQSPSHVSALNLAHEMNILPGIVQEV